MNRLKIFVIVYLALLFLAGYPYSPFAIRFDCNKIKRADYIFPARQIQCYLGEEVPK